MRNREISTDPKFRKLYAQLPKEVKQQAVETYRLWRDNPAHPSAYNSRKLVGKFRQRGQFALVYTGGR